MGRLEVPFEVVRRASNEDLFEIGKDGSLEGIFNVEDEKGVSIGG